MKKLLEQRIGENAVDDQDMKVADLNKNGWYVDGRGTTVRSMDDARSLNHDTDKELGSIKMKVKGWTIIFQPLSPKVLDDGVSVRFAGMRWFSGLDSFNLRIQRQNFRKKSHGEIP